MSLFAYGNSVKCSMDINEDGYAVKKIGDYIVLIVADGNGSSKGMISPGAMAVSIMNDYLTHIIKPKTSIKEIYNQMEAAMFAASRCFLSVNAIDEKYSNIYASMTVAVIEEISLNMVYASIGNTEIRLVRNGKINRINKLFSEAYDMYANNEINDEELYSHPKRAMLTSALGVFNEARLDIMMTQLMKEDILIFTTDGLYRCMSPQHVVEILARNGDSIPKAVDKVLGEAMDLECPDNCTMICCYVQDDHGASLEKKYQDIYQGTDSGYRTDSAGMSREAQNKTDDMMSERNDVYDPYGGYSQPSASRKKKKSYLYR